MSFKSEQSKIAKNQGVSKESAGKILGAAAKKSVAESKRAHKKPKANMKRVTNAQKGKKK